MSKRRRTYAEEYNIQVEDKWKMQINDPTQATINGIPILTTGAAVSSVTTIGSAPNNNGATISGGNITLQPADGTHGGILTAGTQTIGGAKTFIGTPTTINQIVLTNLNPYPSPASYTNILSVYDYATTTNLFPVVGTLGAITQIHCDGVDIGSNLRNFNFLRIGAAMIVRLPLFQVTADAGTCVGLSCVSPNGFPVGYRPGAANNAGTQVVDGFNGAATAFNFTFTVTSDGGFIFQAITPAGAFLPLTTPWGLNEPTVFTTFLI